MLRWLFGSSDDGASDPYVEGSRFQAFVARVPTVSYQSRWLITCTCGYGAELMGGADPVGVQQAYAAACELMHFHIAAHR